MNFGLAEIVVLLGVIASYLLVAVVVIFLTIRLIRFITRRKTDDG